MQIVQLDMGILLLECSVFFVIQNVSLVLRRRTTALSANLQASTEHSYKLLLFRVCTRARLECFQTQAPTPVKIAFQGVLAVSSHLTIATNANHGWAMAGMTSSVTGPVQMEWNWKTTVTVLKSHKSNRKIATLLTTVIPIFYSSSSQFHSFPFVWQDAVYFVSFEGGKKTNKNFKKRKLLPLEREREKT